MKLRVNLAAKRPVERVSLQKLGKTMLAVLGLWLVLNLAGMILVAQRHEKVVARLAETSAGASDDGADSAKQTALQDEVKQADRIMGRRAFRWSQILDDLEKTWLDGIQVRSIEPDFEKKTLKIQVLARNEAVFREYLSKLLQYKAFPQVLLLSQENIDIRDARGRRLAAVRCDLRIRGGF